MLRELIIKNRSYRRFYQESAVEEETLRGLIDLARLSPSAANLQALRYIISYEPKKNAAIFSHLSWAGYLKEWIGPKEGERPSAYIVVLGDTRISKNFWCGYGIAAQSILLGAAELGLGGCMIGSINKEELRNALDIPEYYEIHIVIAIGKPKEKVVIEQAKDADDIKYWRDERGVHHVPKRSLDEIIINNKRG